MTQRFGKSATHPLAGLASPSSIHPVAYAEYVAETLTAQQAEKVHPANAIKALFSLLATKESSKFDAAWKHWENRRNVAGPFAEQLQEHIAASLGRMTPSFFERAMETLKRHPALALQAMAGLRAGFGELAAANWEDNQMTAYAAEKALDYLTPRPAYLQWLVSDPAPLSRFAQKTVEHRSHPSHAFSLLGRIASQDPVLAEAIIAGAEEGKTAVTDPCRLDQVERFLSGLRRSVPAVPTAA